MSNPGLKEPVRNQYPLTYGRGGHLKPGIHSCDLTQALGLTLTNSHRRMLGRKLLAFLRWRIKPEYFSTVYIGGGFVSRSRYPKDIDLILETRDVFGAKSFAAIAPFFSYGLDKVLDFYSLHLHFWMEGAPPAIIDYRSFFQYVRPNPSTQPNFRERGILRLSIPSEGIEKDIDTATRLYLAPGALSSRATKASKLIPLEKGTTASTVHKFQSKKSISLSSLTLTPFLCGALPQALSL